MSTNQAVKEYSFEDEKGTTKLDYEKLLKSLPAAGFQATHLGRAIGIVNEMLEARRKPFVINSQIEDEFIRPRTACTLFLAYTSNMISSGLRGSIRFLVKNKLIDCIVTTAGGIEEDLIKSLPLEADKPDGPRCETYVGDFKLSGSHLRDNGINRIGNLCIPSANYCRFEDWIMPIFNKMQEEQKDSDGKTLWSPSKMIERLGLEINHEDSVCYWAARNKIPIFCPGLTDGSLGDMLDQHHIRSPGLTGDFISDVYRLNAFARNTVNDKTGVIILGGGLPKHHSLNANLMRNGADYAVYINTAVEYDGSDSGAAPDEAISWGKLKKEVRSVKVSCDATIAFPLLVSQTFFPHLQREDVHKSQRSQNK